MRIAPRMNHRPRQNTSRSSGPRPGLSMVVPAAPSEGLPMREYSAFILTPTRLAKGAAQPATPGLPNTSEAELRFSEIGPHYDTVRWSKADLPFNVSGTRLPWSPEARASDAKCLTVPVKIPEVSK